MIRHIPPLKSTVKGVRWWNHQEWANSTQESVRHLKRIRSLHVYLKNHLCCCSSELVLQGTETGYRTCLFRCWFNLSGHTLLQASGMRVFSSFNGSICFRNFLHPFIWGRNYSLLGVKQEVVCVADACLFGFHVSMATGTYLPCAVSTVVHMVHAMCHYCILHTFLQSKEQRVQCLI